MAVDLAKSVFQLAVADEHWKIIETHRLTRTQFERWFANRDVRLVIMEACGSAHHWARWLTGLGIDVRLLPAQYIRAYVKRNKTDAADAAALLEAARASDIRPVRVKSVEQQALQGLHRIRSLWMGTRTSRINALRGFCREFGIAIPVGARTGIEAISRPRATDADNSSGSLPAACNDWRAAPADSMSAQHFHDPTSDAGYTTAGEYPKAKLSVGFLLFRGSPYMNG
ncbi:IS110 family transposase [Xenophilus arseniciresistens]|uniref:IS110 family transposase n=1 Tax=Xenophilus arseniciresistens TaxID=1283306 RepID=A0AAE3NAD7_9BURK|nr:IS110 family transposase [Xenophilus arseniciresistens]MDA7418006.1 IS110 family transposase [Xenophilus arseniciresistens]